MPFWENLSLLTWLPVRAGLEHEPWVSPGIHDPLLLDAWPSTVAFSVVNP